MRAGVLEKVLFLLHSENIDFKLTLDLNSKPIIQVDFLSHLLLIRKNNNRISYYVKYNNEMKCLKACEINAELMQIIMDGEKY